MHPYKNPVEESKPRNSSTYASDAYIEWRRYIESEQVIALLPRKILETKF